MTATLKDTAAAIAANRFGLGARPGELPGIGADAAGWLLRQLKGAPPVLEGEGSSLPPKRWRRSSSCARSRKSAEKRGCQ